MDYNLSGKNDSDKRKYEEFIAQEEEKWAKLSIERTKAEREQAQNKGKENNFEGRCVK